MQLKKNITEYQFSKGKLFIIEFNDYSDVELYLKNDANKIKIKLNDKQNQQIKALIKLIGAQQHILKKYLKENYQILGQNEQGKHFSLNGGGNGNAKKIDSIKVDQKLKTLPKNELDQLQLEDLDKLRVDYLYIIEYQKNVLLQETTDQIVQQKKLNKLSELKRKKEIIEEQEKRIKEQQQSVVKRYMEYIEGILNNKKYINQLSGDRQNFVASKQYFIDLFQKYLECLLRLSDYEIYCNNLNIQKQIKKLKKFERICQDLQEKYPVQEILFYLSLMIKIQEINLEIYNRKYNNLSETLEYLSSLYKLGYYGFKMSLGDVIQELVNIGIKIYKKFDAFSSQEIFNSLLCIDILRIQFLSKKLSIQKEENIYKSDFEKCFDKQYLGFQYQEILFYISLVVDKESNLRYIQGQNDIQFIYVLNKIDYLLTINFLQTHQKDSLIQFSKNCQNNEFNLFNDEVKMFIKYICSIFDTEFNEILMYIQDSEVQKLRIIYIIVSIMVKLFKIFSQKEVSDEEIIYIDDKADSILQNLWHHICYIFIITRRQEILTIFNFSGNTFCLFLSQYLEEKKNIEQLKLKFNVTFTEFEQKSIDKMVSIWNQFVEERKQQKLELKDDLLQEVQDFYINQRFKYLKGCNIFPQKMGEGNLININPRRRLTTIDKIRNYFKLKKQKNQISSTTLLIKENFLKQSDCVVLVILAEGGTGKSMLLKKLQIDLTRDESQQYFPILIKCNQLNQKHPTIEDVIFWDECFISKFDLIAIKKSTKRQKVILLDGYDEYTGENFNIYTDLNLSEWRNTKVILTSRKEKLDEHSIVQFVEVKERGRNSKSSFCILDLLQFNDHDIQSYCANYLDKYIQQLQQDKIKKNTEQVSQMERSQKIIDNDESIKKLDTRVNKIIDKLNNILELGNIYNLVKLPINLYLLTRIINEPDISQISLFKYTDQVSLQQIFFQQHFKREAQIICEILSQSGKYPQSELIKIQDQILDQYFQYFQSIAFKMFLQKGYVEQFLIVNSNDIPIFITKNLKTSLKDTSHEELLIQRIQSYINTQIFNYVSNATKNTVISEEKQKQPSEVQFKHKSIFEYFVAKAMIDDFNQYEKQEIELKQLSIETLKDFKINQRLIMMNIQNQSEPEILIKLSQFFIRIIQEKLNKNEIQYQRQAIQYYVDYIQLTKQLSGLNIGSSNLLSALFYNNYFFDNLNLSDCSFPYAYLFQCNKGTVKFTNSNLKYALTQESKIEKRDARIQNTIGNIFDSQYIKFDQMQIDDFEFSFDFQYYALYNQQELQIWQYDVTFTLIQQLQGNFYSQQTARIQSGFTQCNRYYITKSGDIWDLNDKKFIILKNDDNTLDNQQDNIQNYSNNYFLIISFGNPFLLTVYKNQIKVWNIDKQFKLYRVENRSYKIYNAQYSYKCKFLAIQDMYKIQILDGYDFNLLQSYEFGTFSQFYQFSFDERYFVLKQQRPESIIIIFNTQGQKLKEFKEPIQNSYNLKFSYCSNFLQFEVFQLKNYGSYQKKIKLYNSFLDIENDFKQVGSFDQNIMIQNYKDKKVIIKKGQLFIVDNLKNNLPLLSSINTAPISITLFSNLNKYFVVISNSIKKIYNINNGFQFIKEIYFNDQIQDATFSQNDKYFALVFYQTENVQICKVFDVEKQFQFVSLIEGNQIQAIKFNSNFEHFIICDQNCINVYSTIKHSQLIHTIQNTQAYSIDVCLKNNYLITLSKKSFQIWDSNKAYQLILERENKIEFNTFLISSSQQFIIAQFYCDNQSKILILDTSNNFQIIQYINTFRDTKIEQLNIIQNRLILMDKGYIQIWEFLENRFEHVISIDNYYETRFCLDNYTINKSYNNDQKCYYSLNNNQYLCKINYNEVNITNGNLDFHLNNLPILILSYRISSLAFSPNSKYLVTCTFEYLYQIWNVLDKFNLISIIQINIQETDALFSQDSKYLSLYGQNYCKILNVQKQFIEWNEIKIQNDIIISILFSQCCNYLITGTTKGVFTIFNIKENFQSVFKSQFQDNIRSISQQKQNNYLAVALSKGIVTIYSSDIQSFEIIKEIKIQEKSLIQIDFSPNGQYLAAISPKQIYVWNVFNSFQRVNIFELECKPKQFIFTDKYMVIADIDKGLLILNINQNFKLYRQCKVHFEEMECLDISKDYKYLAIGFKGNMCKIWDFEKYTSRDEILYSF